MKRPKDVSSVWVTCSCGEQQPIPLAAIYNPIACASCGENSSLPPDHVANVEAAYAAGFSKAMRKIVRGEDRACIEVALQHSPEQ